MNGDFNVVAVPGQCLVHCVVDNFVDKVMQATLTGGTDVHARPLANRLKSLENGDVLCVVTALLLRALIGAAVSGQKSSEHIETPRGRAERGKPGRRKLVV